MKAQLEFSFSRARSANQRQAQATGQARPSGQGEADTPLTVPELNASERKQVIEQTRRYIQRANQLFRINASCPEIRFDLKGRAAGMYRVNGKCRVIRYNTHLFSKYFSDNIASTVPHEVAHYISDMIYGLGNIKPHGHEWKSIMQAFGADSSVTASYSLEGIPHRKQSTYTYRCECRVHELSATRHNRVLRKKGRYICQQCRQLLQPAWQD